MCEALHVEQLCHLVEETLVERTEFLGLSLDGS